MRVKTSMTSIQQFRRNLRKVGIPTLTKAEEDLRSITFNQMDKLGRLKLSLSHFLNTLYYEMLDFETWLEQETRKIESKAVRLLIIDLKQDMGLTLALREEVLALETTVNFRQLLISRMRRLLTKIVSLRKILEKYLEDLEMFELKIVDASDTLKKVYDFILEAPVLIGKIRLEISVLEKDTFLLHRENIAAPLEDLSEKVEDHSETLNKLKEVSGLKRILATLEFLTTNLDSLVKKVRRTDPKVWGRGMGSFDLFKRNLLKDLEEILRTLAGVAEDLEEVQEELAA